jgi:hypothetical protein
MDQRHIDLPPGTPGSYVRIMGAARARLREGVGATTAGVRGELSDLLEEIALQATECCRVGIATVRRVIVIDGALIASLEGLILEVVNDPRKGADPRDVALAQAVSAALAKASSGPASRGEGSVDEPALVAAGRGRGIKASASRI